MILPIAPEGPSMKKSSSLSDLRLILSRNLLLFYQVFKAVLAQRPVYTVAETRISVVTLNPYEERIIHKRK